MPDYTLLSQTDTSITRYCLDETGVTVEKFFHHGIERTLLTADEMRALTRAWMLADPHALPTVQRVPTVPHTRATLYRDLWATEMQTNGTHGDGLPPVEILHLPDEPPAPDLPEERADETVLQRLWRLNAAQQMHWTMEQCEQALELAHVPPYGLAQDWEGVLTRVVALLTQERTPAQE